MKNRRVNANLTDGLIVFFRRLLSQALKAGMGWGFAPAGVKLLPMKNMPNAMQTVWKPKAGHSSRMVVKPGVWERTPPTIETIQTKPRTRNSTLRVRKTVFMVSCLL
jgi:hypothetical protein